MKFFANVSTLDLNGKRVRRTREGDQRRGHSKRVHSSEGTSSEGTAVELVGRGGQPQELDMANGASPFHRDGEREIRGGFDSGLTALTDEARRAEAVAARQRRSDRKLSAALSGTFSGTLTELAETGAAVTVHLRSGHAVRGSLEALGPDIVIVSTGDATHAVVSRLAIEGIRESGAGHDRMVDSIESGPDLAQILDTYGEGHKRIAVTLSTGNQVMGRVDRVGLDQLVLRLDGDGDSMTVPLFAIDQVVLT